MRFILQEISPQQLSLSAAKCEASVWGNSNPAALLKDNIQIYSTLQDPLMLLACDEGGAVVGFRYAHALPPENGKRILYDQNGGVAPSSRRNGIARAMLREQHRIAEERGYEIMRTDTAIPLKPMIILNLQEGFEITDLYWNEKFQVKVITFEKTLTCSSAAREQGPVK
jgi:predicted GNAT superfamily acetyltransferase